MCFCSCLSFTERLIAEQQSEVERWTFKAITKPSHINWKKSLYLVRPEQWSQCWTVSSFVPFSKYYRSWLRSDARPFLAAYLVLTAANQKRINIYLDNCHAESWCLWTTARWITSCKYNLFLPSQQLMESQKNVLVAWALLHKTLIFFRIIIQVDSWQEKWSIPSCRA